MISEEIPPALAGERVDRIVAMLTDCSRAEASTAIGAGQCVLDGEVVSKPSIRLTEGQRLDILIDPVVHDAPPEPDAGVVVDVVYEDSDIAVVDKAAGLVVHPAAGVKNATLVNGLLARFPGLAEIGETQRPGIVHRLDRGTSGLMVVALTESARQALVEQMASHDVERRYDALVWGHLETPRGTIDAPIGRSRRNPLRMTVAADGRWARTHYELVAEFSGPRPVTRLLMRLETGRTHQIRVHLASIGHPVVGDELYAGPRPALGVSRPFLHATHLAFVHPSTGETVTFDSLLPRDLSDPLSRLS